MNIQIVGYGVVGKAQGECLKHLGHNIYPVDPVTNPQNQIVNNVDITFICAPEKTVPNIVAHLTNINHTGLIVIKSTVPTGTTKKLSEQHNIHICHNPEFLRENLAVQDTLNPSRIVIGACCQQHANQLKQLYQPLNKPIYISDPTTTETAKLVANCQRAVMISFWNELSKLCEVSGANIKDVADISDPAKVIGEYEGGKWGTRFFGKAYGGKCLPKDMKQLITVFQDNNLKAPVLEATEQTNQHIATKGI
jgi:UDPglucose 6-dehydrogenase